MTILANSTLWYPTVLGASEPYPPNLVEGGKYWQEKPSRYLNAFPP